MKLIFAKCFFAKYISKPEKIKEYSLTPSVKSKHTAGVNE